MSVFFYPDPGLHSQQVPLSSMLNFVFCSFLAAIGATSNECPDLNMRDSMYDMIFTLHMTSDVRLTPRVLLPHQN